MSGKQDQKTSRAMAVANAAPAQAISPELIAKFIAAAKKRDIAELEKFFQQDTRVINGVDKDKKTALHHAVSKSHDAVVVFLLANDADVSKRDDDSYTALELAVKDNKVALVKLLMIKASLDELGKAIWVIENVPVEKQATHRAKISKEKAEKQKKPEDDSVAQFIKKTLEDEIRKRNSGKGKAAVSAAQPSSVLLDMDRKKEAFQILQKLQEFSAPSANVKQQKRDDKKHEAEPENSAHAKLLEQIATLNEDKQYDAVIVEINNFFADIQDPISPSHSALFYAHRAYAHQKLNNHRQTIIDFVDAITYRSDSLQTNFEQEGFVITVPVEFRGLINRLQNEPNRSREIRREIDKLLEQHYPVDQKSDQKLNRKQRRRLAQAEITDDEKIAETAINEALQTNNKELAKLLFLGVVGRIPAYYDRHIDQVKWMNLSPFELGRIQKLIHEHGEQKKSVKSSTASAAVPSATAAPPVVQQPLGPPAASAAASATAAAPAVDSKAAEEKQVAKKPNYKTRRDAERAQKNEAKAADEKRMAGSYGNAASSIYAPYTYAPQFFKQLKDFLRVSHKQTVKNDEDSLFAKTVIFPK